MINFIVVYFVVLFVVSLLTGILIGAMDDQLPRATDTEKIAAIWFAVLWPISIPAVILYVASKALISSVKMHIRWIRNSFEG